MRIKEVKNWIIVGTMMFLPCAVQAAGLGKLTVFSALGEPLRAEIELVSVEPDELGSLTARMAPTEAFKQADIEYAAVLLNVKLSIEKKKTGENYIRLTSDRPINEPFLDLLLELSWTSGRIVREYTTLIDPPSFAPAEPAVPVAPPQVKALPPVVSPVKREPRSARTTPASETQPDYGPVKRGDTLSKIARNTRPEGVSLEQTLVGLFKNNRDAFDGNNMNRLKTGKIIHIPDATEIDATPQDEALKEIRAQSSDWNAYRKKLAQAATETTEEDSAKQTASGKISAKIDDASAVVGAKEVLKLSKGESGKDGAKGAAGLQAKIDSLEEEAIAREKTVNEANERVAQLEKNIKDMQHVLELSNQQLAALQSQSSASQPAAQPPAETQTEVKPEIAETPPATQAPPLTAAETPAESVSETPAQTPPVQPTPEQPKPKPQAPAPQPEPEPGIVGQILGQPLYLAALVGVIVLLLVVLAVRRRRGGSARIVEPVKKGKKEKTIGVGDLDKTVAMDQASMQAAAAGGGAQSAEDFDPIAEAEVFIAYGRDAQAEEILKDALTKDPTRSDVRLKLLEIYHARKDATVFGSTAKELHSRTHGEGELWVKAAGMGYSLDPENSLYASGKDTDIPGIIVAAAETRDLDFDIGGVKSVIMSQDEISAASMSDIDLDLDASGAAGTATDFDFGTDAVLGTETDLDIGVPKLTTETDFNLDGESGTETDITLDAAAQTGNVIDFDFDASTEATPLAGQPAVDFGDINLSFEEGKKPTDDAVVHDDHWYDVQTKFDLAKAYQEMGDKEGAREILGEVVQEGSSQQQEEAKALLASLD